ncbi:AEC family transporter [Sulfurospirillum barnesii]|uniref:Putative permease n=1 Tax=Sulfurospirillum barnesii (strain ATCC 700032 / DSM 10660 / SES-3) TaxID=760154 RepID=I3XVC9_SULBS|nr:AEC family transporter [Sulfurospirillum barnesii]AFL67903.1 putative permease [Sulfurospirillum barnesii SES-3]
MTIAISILSIYAFIFLGFMAKRMLKEEMNEKGMILMSIYFLQPMLSFWGLSTKPIELELLQAPFWYLLISFICVLLSSAIAYLFFKDDIKEKSIVTICVVLGNTGNLGIPLGMALFGEASIIYMSMINITNVFVVYTLGVYFYSRGNFSIKQSLLNIIKLPVIWFASLALIMNVCDIQLHPAMKTPLQMGAYCTMVIQLVIFGMYLYNIKLRSINYKLLLHVSLIKFIMTPLIAGWILYGILDLEPMLATLIFIELIVPLAVTNVNLAALYECKPLDVTVLVFFTSLVFIPFFIFVSNLLQHFRIVSLI